jgi:hypothetical protein
MQLAKVSSMVHDEVKRGFSLYGPTRPDLSRLYRLDGQVGRESRLARELSLKGPSGM